MIGHQAISPDLRIRAPHRRRDQTAVKPVILGPEERRHAAIAAVGDMVRQARPLPCAIRAMPSPQFASFRR